MLPNISGRSVWVLVKPWDYTSASIQGVYDSEKSGKHAMSVAIAEARENGERDAYFVLSEQFIE